MDTARVGSSLQWAFGGALALLLAAAAPLLRADEADLRERALALNSVTGEDPIKGQIQVLADDAEGTRKLLKTALVMAKEKPQPFNFNAAYILARASRAVKELDAGEVFYRICGDQAGKLKSGQKLVLAYGGLIDLLYENKKYAESEKVCREFLELSDEDGQLCRLQAAVQRRMVQALAKQEKIAEAIKLVDNLLKIRGDDWLTLELKGWVQREAGQYADAAKTYEDVLKLIDKDKSLEKGERTDFKEFYQYTLSGVYVDHKQIDKAAEHLKALLAEKPNDPTYNNDLGFIWADHDMHLEEAEKLIRKAIEEDRKQRKTGPNFDPETDKDNPAYLDSLGWVLYKQKKYKEAKLHLLSAVQEKSGQHIEILDHLGDVHMALGEKAEALAAWKKGVEVAGPTKREQQRKAQVEKKLKEVQQARK